jgi:hypothetical protein
MRAEPPRGRQKTTSGPEEQGRRESATQPGLVISGSEFDAGRSGDSCRHCEREQKNDGDDDRDCALSRRIVPARDDFKSLASYRRERREISSPSFIFSVPAVLSGKIVSLWPGRGREKAD